MSRRTGMRSQWARTKAAKRAAGVKASAQLEWSGASARVKMLSIRASVSRLGETAPRAVITLSGIGVSRKWRRYRRA